MLERLFSSSLTGFFRLGNSKTGRKLPLRTFLGLLLAGCFFTLQAPSPAWADTRWDAATQPKFLTPAQARFYPDLTTWAPPARPHHLLLLKLPAATWTEIKTSLNNYPELKKILYTGRFGFLTTRGETPVSHKSCAELLAAFKQSTTILPSPTPNAVAAALKQHNLTVADLRSPSQQTNATNQPGNQANWETAASRADSILSAQPANSQIILVTDPTPETGYRFLASFSPSQSSGIITNAQLPTPGFAPVTALPAEIIKQMGLPNNPAGFSAGLGTVKFKPQGIKEEIVVNEVSSPAAITDFQTRVDFLQKQLSQAASAPTVFSIWLVGLIVTAGLLAVNLLILFPFKRLKNCFPRSCSALETVSGENILGSSSISKNTLGTAAFEKNQSSSKWIVQGGKLLSWLILGPLFGCWVYQKITGYLYDHAAGWILSAPTLVILFSTIIGALILMAFFFILCRWVRYLHRQPIVVQSRVSTGKLGVFSPRSRKQFLNWAVSFGLVAGFTLLNLTTTGFAGAPGGNEQYQPLVSKEIVTEQKKLPPVVVVFAEGLQWSDWKESAVAQKILPRLQEASTFNFIPINQRTAPCPQDVWLTLSAGTRPEQNSLGGSSICTGFPSATQLNQLAASKQPIPFWDYYQTISRAYGLRTPIGTLGQALQQNGIKMSALGNIAALASVDQSGVIQAKTFALPSLSDSEKTWQTQVQKALAGSQVTFVSAAGDVEQVNRNPYRFNPEAEHQRYVLRKTLEKITATDRPNGQPLPKDWSVESALFSSGWLDDTSMQEMQLSKFAQQPDKSGKAHIQIGTTPPEIKKSTALLNSELPTTTQVQLTHLTRLLTANPTKYAAQLTKWRKDNAAFLPTLPIREAESTTEISRQFVAYQDEQFQRLERILTAIPDGYRVLVVSASSARLPQAQQMGFVYGPGLSSQPVFSSSVKHKGLVQAADLTPTLLNWVGLSPATKNINLNGSTLSFAASTPPTTTNPATTISNTISASAAVSDSTSVLSPPTGESTPKAGSAFVKQQNILIGAADRAEAALAAGSSYYQFVSKIIIWMSLLAILALNAGWWQGWASLFTRSSRLFSPGRNPESTHPLVVSARIPPTVVFPLTTSSPSWYRFLPACLSGFFELCFLYLAALPLAGFLAGAFPWWEAKQATKAFLVLALLIALVLTFWAKLGPWGHLPLGPGLFLGLLNLWFYGLDIWCGSRVIQDSPVGFLTLIGGRFYGMGNEGYSLLATSLLMLLAVWGFHRFQISRGHCYRKQKAFLSRFSPSGSRLASRWVTNAVILMAGLAFIYLDGAPSLGADFGGPVSFLPGLAILFLMLNRWRISFGKLFLIGSLTVAVSATLCIADYLRPPQNRTHLGRFVQSILDGQLTQVLGHKANGNLGTLLVSPHRWSVLFAVILCLLVLVPAVSASRCRATLHVFQPGTLQSPQENTFSSGRGRWQRINLALAAWTDHNYGWLGSLPGQPGLPGLLPAFGVLLASIGTCQFFAFALNDSGINLTGLAVQCFLYPLLATWLGDLSKRHLN